MMTDTAGPDRSSTSPLAGRLGPSCMSRTLAGHARRLQADAPNEGSSPIGGGIPRSSHDVPEAAPPREDGRMVACDLATQCAALLPCAHVAARLLDAIAEERLGDAPPDEPALGGTDPEVPVLVTPAHVRVVAAHGAPHLAPEEGAGLQAVAHTKGIGTPTPGLDTAGGGGEGLAVRIGDPDGGGRPEEGPPLLQPLPPER